MTSITSGDRVMVTLRGQTIEAVVLLASPCGKSLAVEFDGVIGGWFRNMPLLREADGTYRDFIGQVVIVKQTDRHAAD